MIMATGVTCFTPFSSFSSSSILKPYFYLKSIKPVNYLGCNQKLLFEFTLVLVKSNLSAILLASDELKYDEHLYASSSEQSCVLVNGTLGSLPGVRLIGPTRMASVIFRLFYEMRRAKLLVFSFFKYLYKDK